MATGTSTIATTTSTTTPSQPTGYTGSRGSGSAEVEEELAALQQVLPLNNELVQQWPQLFDELEEEEVGAILYLEAEEVAELLEAEEVAELLEAEAQQHLRMPLKSQSS